MRIHFTTGMLKAFLLSTISLNCWAAVASTVTCSGTQAAGCDGAPDGAGHAAMHGTVVIPPAGGKNCSDGSQACATPLPSGHPSPGASTQGNTSPSSASGSTEGDGGSDSGSETDSSDSALRTHAADSLSVHSASPGRSAVHIAPPLPAGTRFVPAIYLPTLGNMPTIHYLTTVGVGVTAITPGGMPLLAGTLQNAVPPAIASLTATPLPSVERAQIVHSALGTTVISGVPGLEHLTPEILIANPAIGSLLAAYPAVLRQARILFVPAEDSVPAKKITDIINKVPAIELASFTEEVQSLRLLMPKAFEDDGSGIVLSKVMSLVSAITTPAERTLLIEHLRTIHSLDSEAFANEMGSRTLIRLTTAMARLPGAKRATLLTALQPLLDKSLDRTEVISLTFEMPDTHIVPVLQQIRKFINAKSPSRKFAPILQVNSRHFDPTNPAKIVQITDAAMSITRRTKSSEDHANIIEGFARIPSQKIGKVKANIRLLEKPHMSGKDIATLVQALAQGHVDHIEKAAGYTTAIIDEGMSANDISVIISTFYSIFNKPRTTAVEIEAINHHFKPLLRAVKKYGKIRHSETYGHMLRHIAELPSHTRKAVVGEALRYLANPTNYHSTLEKRTEDAAAQWSAAQRALDEIAPEAIRLETIAKEKKAAAEAAVQEWKDHLPIIEDYRQHEAKLEAIKVTALANQRQIEQVLGKLEEAGLPTAEMDRAVYQETKAQLMQALAAEKKKVRGALEELENSAAAKQIAMDVLEELKLASGTKSTEAAEAARQASISLASLRAVIDRIEELEVTRNSTEAMRLVDNIFAPERTLGRGIIRKGPSWYEEDEYLSGFTAHTEPMSAAGWSKAQAAAAPYVPTIRSDFAKRPTAPARTKAEELAHKKADLENAIAWAEAAGTPWPEAVKEARRQELEPMLRSDW